jgi:hypothetical protein
MICKSLAGHLRFYPLRSDTAMIADLPDGLDTVIGERGVDPFPKLAKG